MTGQDDGPLMSSEYEAPEIEEIGSVEDVTGGSIPGSADGNTLST